MRGIQLIYKTATLRDIRLIRRINRLAYRKYYEGHKNWTGYKASYFIMAKYLLNKNRITLKVISNNVIVGTVSVYINSKDRTYYIDNLCVLPKYQNHGMGKTIMKQVESMFGEADCWRLYTPEDDRKNNEFYKKLGYSIKAQRTLDDITVNIFEKNTMRK